MNRVFLVGRLGRDVEFRTKPNGGSNWATFSLATNRSRKTETGWTDDTDWHRIMVFQTQAELCHRHLHKGDLVAIEGSVTYDTWTDKEGTQRKGTTIMTDRVHFLEKVRPKVQTEMVAEAK